MSTIRDNSGDNVPEDIISGKKVVVDAIPPVPVTVIGTGDGGALASGTVAHTPPNQPNIIVKVIDPVVALVVRFAHVLVNTFVTSISAGLTSDLLPVSNPTELFYFSVKLSLLAAAIALGKDVVVVLAQLTKKYPLLTGSV